MLASCDPRTTVTTTGARCYRYRQLQQPPRAVVDADCDDDDDDDDSTAANSAKRWQTLPLHPQLSLRPLQNTRTSANHQPPHTHTHDTFVTPRCHRQAEMLTTVPVEGGMGAADRVEAVTAMATGLYHKREFRRAHVSLRLPACLHACLPACHASQSSALDTDKQRVQCHMCTPAFFSVRFYLESTDLCLPRHLSSIETSHLPCPPCPPSLPPDAMPTSEIDTYAPPIAVDLVLAASLPARPENAAKRTQIGSHSRLLAVLELQMHVAAGGGQGRAHGAVCHSW
jgi:hypothetical protein